MSRGASMFLGVMMALFGGGFIVLPLVGTLPKPGAFFALGAYCEVVAIACLVPITRPVTVRLVAIVIVTACAWIVCSVACAHYFGTAPMRGISPGGAWALTGIGLAASYFAVRGAGHKRSKPDQPAKPRRTIYIPLPSFSHGFVASMLRMEGFTIDPTVRPSIVREIACSAEQHTRRWRTIIGTWASSLPLFVGIGLGFLGAPLWICLPLTFVMFALWVMYWREPRRDVRLRIRRQVLNAHGYPICMACGQNLTGLATDHPCPECGWGRERAEVVTDASR